MNTTFPVLEVSNAAASPVISPSLEKTRIKKYNSIDILRLLCAVMVVAIHTEPLMEYQNLSGYFATYIFPRLGVPFFFAVSGYFYINGLLQGRKVFLKYIKRLLAIYTIWSLIYYLVDFIEVLRNHYSIKEFAINSVNNFFLSGSNYQLWFFPTLIFCVIVTTLFRRQLAGLTVISLLLYSVGCLTGAYYKFGEQIPFINSLYNSSQLETIRRNLLMGLPFFLLGYILIKLYPKLDKIKSKVLILAFCLIFALFLAEIFIGKALSLQANIIMTVFLYPLLALVLVLCLRYPLPQWELTARFCKISANFMYYSHPLFMFIMSRTLTGLFDLTLSGTAEFLLTCLLTVLSSFIIYKINNRHLNRLVQ